MAPKISNSAPRRAPGRPELITERNPLGLPDKRGFYITKTGYKRVARAEKVKAKANIGKTTAYKAYKSLKKRPLGMVVFEKDSNGHTLIKHGELFCRAALLTGGLCHKIDQFSSTGNLTHHVMRSHGLKVASKRTGAKSKKEVEELQEWYEGVMEVHDRRMGEVERGEGDGEEGGEVKGGGDGGGGDGQEEGEVGEEVNLPDGEWALVE